MAHLHNLKHNTNPSSLDSFGQKVRSVAGTVAGVVGTAKGLYDIGKTIYDIGRAALPIIEAIT